MISEQYTVDDATFRITPDRGCNLYVWRVDDRDVLWCPPGFPERGRYSAGGVPLLFPAVGRTWDRTVSPPQAERYRLAGQTRPLRMPLHGVLDQCGAERIAAEQLPDGWLLRYSINIPESVADECYPHRVALEVQLLLRRLRVEVRVLLHNRGSHPAPYAFGAHPYLVVATPGRRGVELDLPARAERLLDDELLVPSGERRSVSGFRLAPELGYDSVFTDLSGDDAVLRDPAAGRAIHVAYDEAFTDLVVYAPAESSFVCVEPWTAGLDGYAALADEDWPRRGSICVLQPDQRVELAISLTVHGQPAR